MSEKKIITAQGTSPINAISGVSNPMLDKPEVLDATRAAGYGDKPETPAPTGESALRELIVEWRDDARKIRSNCDTPHAPSVPCDCCEWHAIGLEQAARELDAALASQHAQAEKE